VLSPGRYRMHVVHYKSEGIEIVIHEILPAG
jgi:hypothetical protein